MMSNESRNSEIFCNFQNGCRPRHCGTTQHGVKSLKTPTTHWKNNWSLCLQTHKNKWLQSASNKPHLRQKPTEQVKKDFKINSTILFRCYAAAKLCWVGFITAPKSSEVFLAHCYVVAKMLWVDSWCVICSFLLSKRAIPKFSMIFWSLDMAWVSLLAQLIGFFRHFIVHINKPHDFSATNTVLYRPMFAFNITK